MHVRAVFFDIDDTLVDHVTAMSRATEALYRRLAPQVGFDEFVARWKAAHGRHYPRFLEGETTYEQAVRSRVRETIDPFITDDAADALFTQYLADYESGWALFPDVMACLDRMTTVPLGVISNGRSAEQKRKLKVLGIIDRFRWVCISEEVGFAKPARQIFERACAEAGVTPGDTLYIGDQYEVDACAAHAAGLQCIWLNRRGTTVPHCQAISMRSLDELRL